MEGCFCGLGLTYSNRSCKMPPITFQDLPLNIYMVIFGTGIFIFVLSLIFCCYFISEGRALWHQGFSVRAASQYHQYGSQMVCLQELLQVLERQEGHDRNCSFRVNALESQLIGSPYISSVLEDVELRGVVRGGPVALLLGQQATVCTLIDRGVVKDGLKLHPEVVI
ncbi:RING finger protein 122-like [Scleropages formosus]|uniref:RING finger protein 122-like n=1 Tax=Scleropages formosus TaxID=113540 RepID=A0A0N8K0Z7_SCLFO|nr:RING finger protein 122-like [Scleropages formosus]